jgi:nucleotide-binding universal stress UspA family protein
MTRFKNILFPTDFSDCARHAEAYAVAFAACAKGTLHVCHAIDTAYLAYFAMYGQTVVVDPKLDEIQAQAKADLAAVADRAKERGAQAKTYLLSGSPISQTLDLARQIDADLIVVGTHGRTGFEKVLLGSTCEAVIRRSPAPVLAVKEREHEFVKNGGLIELNRILVPCDFSGPSKEAVPIAAALAREFKAKAALIHVIDVRAQYPQFLPGMGLPNTEPLHSSAAAMLKDVAAQFGGVEVETRVADGIPHREIVTSVDAQNIDLVVMGTHGRTGLGHALLGSTAEKVVRVARCPVLTVRPEAARHAAEPEGAGAAAAKR